MYFRRLQLRLALGVFAMFIIAVVVLAVGVNSDGRDVQAAGTTPTKIANDGNLGGVYDILIGDLATNVGFFYCITKIDHATSNDEIKTSAQCNIDLPDQGETGDSPPTWADTCETLGSPVCEDNELNNPSEPGADLISGPPPPPPYTTLPPSKGFGFFYPGGVGAMDAAGEPVTCATDCLVTVSCIEDVGPPGGLGPNIISVVVIHDPKNPQDNVGVDLDGDTIPDTTVDGVSQGFVDIYYNQNNANCKTGTPFGASTFDDLSLFSIRVNDSGGANPNSNPAPWRAANAVSTIDWDGDGCTDEDELDKSYVPPGSGTKCGDDPQNPSDSFDPSSVDLTGVYTITARGGRGDCADEQCLGGLPAVYISCIADLRHIDNGNVILRPYCYLDIDGLDVNTEAYPGVTGDGFAGGPPPGPETATGNGNYAYGDVDGQHSEFIGIFNRATNNIEVTGCLSDPDNSSGLGNVFLDVIVSAHQLPSLGGGVIYLAEPDDCAGSPVGTPLVGDITITQTNPVQGRNVDHDNDGVPTAAELQDDDTCGRRDPFNKNDYYDVSIPRDGVIDLANDILGVILKFNPGGYPPGDENWDRPAAMTNVINKAGDAGGHWNRGSPDGVIDLANDILGVILQFNPGGCSPPA